jgi:hypothetical protein
MAATKMSRAKAQRRKEMFLPFCKEGRGDFHSREVMVETEAVMEKIYRVAVEREGM